jgi:hypothetical protein
MSPTRGPALPPCVVVDALRDRVDPPPAQGLGNRLLPRQAAIRDAFVLQAYPQLGLGVMVQRQPRTELLGSVEEARRPLGRAAHPTRDLVPCLVTCHAKSLPPIVVLHLAAGASAESCRRDTAPAP